MLVMRSVALHKCRMLSLCGVRLHCIFLNYTGPLWAKDIRGIHSAKLRSQQYLFPFFFHRFLEINTGYDFSFFTVRIIILFFLITYLSFHCTFPSKRFCLKYTAGSMTGHSDELPTVLHNNMPLLNLPSLHHNAQSKKKRTNLTSAACFGSNVGYQLNRRRGARVLPTYVRKL